MFLVLLPALDCCNWVRNDACCWLLPVLTGLNVNFSINTRQWFRFTVFRPGLYNVFSKFSLWWRSYTANVNLLYADYVNYLLNLPFLSSSYVDQTMTVTVPSQQVFQEDHLSWSADTGDIVGFCALCNSADSDNSFCQCYWLLSVVSSPLSRCCDWSIGWTISAFVKDKRLFLVVLTRPGLEST
jgi:hypothetical protein